MTRLLVAELEGLDVSRIGGPARVGVGAAEDATLTVAPLVGEAIALGAFQRARSTIDQQRLEGSGVSLVRRPTGGPALRVGRGQIHLTLSLRRPESLGGVADPERIVNRHVRPLLRALEAIVGPTTYGGRDILTVRGAPVAWVGAGHRVADGASVVEAVIAVRSSFELPPDLDLAHGAIAPRYLGSKPTTLEASLGREVDPRTVVAAIVTAYGVAAEDSLATCDLGRLEATRVDGDEQPFTAMVEEAVGLLGAVRAPSGAIELGGDLFASSDALVSLGGALGRLDAAANDETILGIVDHEVRDALLRGVRDRRAFVRLTRAV